MSTLKRHNRPPTSNGEVGWRADLPAPDAVRLRLETGNGPALSMAGVYRAEVFTKVLIAAECPRSIINAAN